MRVTEKGQVTIPKDIRDRVGIRPGSEVEFGLEGEVITLRPAKGRRRPGPSRGEKAVAALRGTKSRNLDLTTDQIMQLLRGDD